MENKKYNLKSYFLELTKQWVIYAGLLPTIYDQIYVYLPSPINTWQLPDTVESLFLILAFVVANISIYLRIGKELNGFKEIRLDLSIRRTSVGTYNMLEIVNIGKDDIDDLKIKLPDRYLKICDQNNDLLHAHEIEPSSINIGVRILAHFPAQETKVLVTGKGRVSQKKFQKEVTV